MYQPDEHGRQLWLVCLYCIKQLGQALQCMSALTVMDNWKLYFRMQDRMHVPGEIRHSQTIPTNGMSMNSSELS